MALSKFIFGIFGKEEKQIPTIAPPVNDDGAVETEVIGQGMGKAWRAFGYTFDPSYQSTNELISLYREIATHHEVDTAIADICDQAIVQTNDPVVLNLDNTDFSPGIQKKIQEEFDNVLAMLDYRQKGYDKFRRWYIDGRLAYLKVVDPNNTKAGITELRQLDPRSIIKVRDVIRESKDGEDIVSGYNDYFVYKPRTDQDKFLHTTVNRSEMILPIDSVTFVHSGLMDCGGKNIISYLHSAIKPANQLKMLEDAVLIYVISRAPERRVFYIDTGNLPKAKAEAYVRGLMNNFKNKMTYDASTGKVKNGYNAQSMLEDFWLPRREGSKGTEISTLPAGQNSDQTALLDYYKANLYDSLKIPKSRLDSSSSAFGQGTEITRDELKFDRLIRRLQQKFSVIFTDPLRTNLILKKIITEEEWTSNRHNILIEFASDSYFDELREAEVLQMRLQNFSQIEPIIGKYVSNDWVIKNVLMMTGDEFEVQREKILKEQKDPLFAKKESEYD